MSLQAAYDQARTYLETSRIDQAIGVAQHILAAFPENLEAHRILGEAYLAGRQYDQAEAAFSRVLRSDPEHIPAHVGLGITFERQNKLDAAVREFEQALEIRPDMPELRSQLLRLYTDAWGAENATLRLSRPGLARLYAKGHMLPQAVQEFRSVLEEEPDRFDVWVGLAEALWRDGQTDLAAETCVEILAERPDVLKANLLLGYIRYQAGDESGESYWRLAQQLDPYQNLARALFDQLPDIAPPELEIAAWDEAAWAERRAAEAAKAAKAERAATPPQSVSVAPAAGSTGAAADDFFSGWMTDLDRDETPADQLPARPTTSPSDDDFLASLLAIDSDDLSSTSGGVDLDSTSGITPFSFDEESPQPPVTPRNVAPAPLFAEAETPAAEEQMPFSLDELGISTEPETAADEPDLTPFSFEELGLSPDEIAALGDPGAAEAAAPADKEGFALSDLGASLELDQLTADAAAQEAAGEPDLTPFSFEELGLSPDEIAALSDPGRAEPVGEPDLTPFSFEELGLSPDEIAALNEPGRAEPAGAPELTPFSFEELGLSPDEIAALNEIDSTTPAAPPVSAEVEPAAFASADLSQGLDADAGADPALTPFSLDDLGLSPDEIAALESAGAQDAAAARQAVRDEAERMPFDALDSAQAPFEISHDLGDVEPFSLDDLDLSLVGDEADFGAGSLPPSLQPFSLDDAALTPPNAPPPGVPLESGEESDAGGGYSWQQPAAKKSTDFLTGSGQAEPSGPSIFSKLKQRAADLPREEPPPLPPVADDDVDVAHFFSNDHDNVSLRDDDAGQPERLTGAFRLPRAADNAPESLVPTGAVGAAAIGAAAGALAAGTQRTDDTPPPPAEPPAPDTTAAAAEPELVPFSLEELGLSPEEIAALQSAGAAETADATAGFAQTDLGAGLKADQIAAEAAPAEPAEPELTPFSLEELGLSPEEIAALQGASAPAQPAEPELTPFSLEELGLSPEEIAALNAAPEEGTGSAEAVTGDTITPGWTTDNGPELTPFGTDMPAADAGELEPFDFADFDFAEPSTTPDAAIEETFGADVQPFSLDDLGLSDLDLGEIGASNRELDLTDEELAGLDLGELETFIGELPAATAEESQVDTGDPALDRLIVLGQRQGFVDLTDIIAVVEDPEAEAERIEEIGWTLHRAGIQIRDGDEIIDMEETEAIEEDEFAAVSPPASSGPETVELDGEAELTPFSLEELGLSPEEIAALGLAEAETTAAAPEPSPAAPTPEPQPDAEAEPELTPFSLEELGLTPEEIATLGLAEVEPTAAAPEPPPAAPAPEPQPDAEPELTPFSLEELGLSPEEIATLGLAEVETTAAAPEPPPAAPAPEPQPDAEPELTPFSLEELGLSPEEIAALAFTEAEAVEEAPAAATDDLFDFTVAEAEPVEKITRRTAPREEEPPPVNPADLAFTPEPLENLDDIWDLPEETPAEPEPARVVLPPLSERAPSRSSEPAYTDTTTPAHAGRTRDEVRYARREAVIAERTVLRKAGARTLADFIPSGDPALDDYLQQLTTEPTNYPLALAVGRLCAQTGRTDMMTLAYKRPIRDGAALDTIEAEVVELIETVDDQVTQRQLYRVLGDIYSKQGRFREAMTAYSQTYGRKEAD
jgi:tetratricopeptide (TPR) repeat protein